MDDLSVKVSKIPNRTVAFEVSQQEAHQISNYLMNALTNVQDSRIRHIYAGFRAVAEGREFGRH